jgi:hypothetical protein
VLFELAEDLQSYENFLESEILGEHDDEQAAGEASNTFEALLQAAILDDTEQEESFRVPGEEA